MNGNKGFISGIQFNEPSKDQLEVAKFLEEYFNNPLPLNRDVVNVGGIYWTKEEVEREFGQGGSTQTEG